MNLKIECQGRSFVLVPGRTYIVGRHPACDFVVVSDRVSRRQLEISHDGSTWLITDLASTNGTFVDATAIKSHAVTGTLDIVIGGRQGVTIRVALELATAPTQPPTPPPVPPTQIQRPAHQPAPAPPTMPARGARPAPAPVRVPLKHLMRIGRNPDNDFVIDDLLVSRRHAQILRTTDSQWEVFDSKSSNGTFVNGQSITRHRLQKDDVLAVGRTVMRFDGDAFVAPGMAAGAAEGLAQPDGLELVAQNLTVSIAGTVLLRNLSVRLRPCSLTAVIGPSGAGKSTLLAALTGRRPASSGSVHVAGRDLYSGYDELRSRIGLVPQTDLLHTNLTTQRALEYGAALRFSRDTTAAERSARVLEVLKELELLDRAQQRIDTLSGGQKKRTNVALELLTKPALLFLDEPTSGLDPGLDRQVMNLLRDLADKGQTVLVVTHAMDHLNECDNIIILGVGGVLAYYGPPDGVFGHFATDSWAGVFGKLNRPQPMRAGGGAIAGSAQRLAPIRQQPWWFQVGTLVQRYVEVIRADTYYVLMLMVLPLIMAAVGFISGDEFGLGAGAAVEGLPNRNLYARSLLLLLVLGAAFMGAAASILELVKERAIYERERSVGVSNSAYLASKVIVLGVITALQAALFAWLALLGRAGPQAPLIFSSGYLEIVVVVMALAVVSMAAGLVLSALIATGEAAMPALVVFTMTQVVLSGAIQLRYAWMLDGPARLDPAYWAMNAMSASADLNVLSGLHGAERFAWWVHSAAGWQRSMLHLAIMFAALLGAALWRLHHNEKKS